MAKRKMSTSSKKSGKKTPSITQRLEKEFLSLPSQMSTYLGKEISLLKKTESKLKTNLSKLKKQTLQINSPVRMKANEKAVQSLIKQLSTTSESLSSALNKQTKINALRKLLSQFEKNWGKTTKLAKKPSAQQTTPYQIKEQATGPMVEPSFSDTPSFSKEIEETSQETAMNS